MFNYSDDENEAAGAPAQRRAAGRTRRAEEQVPEFGAGQLIGEIDCQRPARCPPPQPARPVMSHMRVLSLTWALFLSRPAAEKFYGEIDRQIRSSNGVRNVVRRHGPGGSVSHEAGADILSQAAIGECLLGYTEAVSGRNSIRTGTFWGFGPFLGPGEGRFSDAQVARGSIGAKAPSLERTLLFLACFPLISLSTCSRGLTRHTVIQPRKRLSAAHAHAHTASECGCRESQAHARLGKWVPRQCLG